MICKVTYASQSTRTEFLTRRRHIAFAATASEHVVETGGERRKTR
jgi:hypothetical protein